LQREPIEILENSWRDYMRKIENLSIVPDTHTHQSAEDYGTISMKHQCHLGSCACTQIVM
jgi:hypothetical protein